MRSPVYFYKMTRDSSVSDRCPLALVSVELQDVLGGSLLPPVVEWEGVLYYWNEDLSGYCEWLPARNILKIEGYDVVNDFRKRGKG